MEEKDYKNNDEKNNILNNIDNIIEKEDNNNKNIKINGEENEEERDSLDVSVDPIKEEKAELGSKIRCPRANCFNNCIILIDPNNLQVNFDCGEHKNKMNIIDFVKKSGIIKEDKEKCSKCKETYEKIKTDKNNKLFKCNCGKNFCQKCKKEHLDENSEKKNEHNMVNFKFKDYTCTCNDKKKRFNSFCFTCQKNLCIACNEKHKDHEKKNFGELFNLTKEKKKDLNNYIIIQKKKIVQVFSIIDDWLRRTKKIIDEYKQKLELYYKINLNILNNYDINKMNYEMIKNVEYICTDFDDNFNNLFNSENDFKKLNSIICNILNEHMKSFIEIPKPNPETMLGKMKIVHIEELNGVVNHLCQLKKEELLIVNIFNSINHREELCIFKPKRENNNLKLEFQLSLYEDSRIIDLKELKNGNLLIIKRKEFKIVEVAKNQDILRNIQIKKLEDDYGVFNDIIELINGCLISISSFINNINRKGIINFWNKNLRNGNYEIFKTINTEGEIPFSILEINKEKFVVLFNNNLLYIFDSKTGQKTKVLEDICNTSFKKMTKVFEDGLLLIYERYIFLFCISSLQVKVVNLYKNINEICYINNSNNYYLASFSELNRYGLFLLNVDLIKYKIFQLTNIIISNAHNLQINCISHINNRYFITGSDDRTLKVWVP